MRELGYSSLSIAKYSVTVFEHCNSIAFDVRWIRYIHSSHTESHTWLDRIHLSSSGLVCMVPVGPPIYSVLYPDTCTVLYTPVYRDTVPAKGSPEKEKRKATYLATYVSTLYTPDSTMQFFRRRTVEVTPSLSHSRARDMHAHAREISDGAIHS
jgi:hypothetical protein